MAAQNLQHVTIALLILRIEPFLRQSFVHGSSPTLHGKGLEDLAVDNPTVVPPYVDANADAAYDTIFRGIYIYASGTDGLGHKAVRFDPSLLASIETEGVGAAVRSVPVPILIDRLVILREPATDEATGVARHAVSDYLGSETRVGKDGYATVDNVSKVVQPGHTG